MASALRQVLDDPIGQPQRIPIYRNEPEFIDRINNPQNYPVIQNPDGSVSTHRMAAESDAQGNFYVFPTIQMEDGRLVEYEDNRQAMDAAFRSGNILQAPNMLSALRYAEGGYKQGTPLAEDQQAARRELENRGVDYKYGGDSVFGAVMPERRRILRPEQEQFVGYDSSGNAIIQNIPAEYGPSEFDPSFSPVVRGARSAGSFLRDIFLGDANEQSAAFGRATSALRGMGEGMGEYVRGQGRAALAGGVSYNPDTGQVDRFDTTVAMGGGNPATTGGTVLGSGMRAGRAARVRPFQQYGGNLEEARNSLNITEEGRRSWQATRSGFKQERPEELRLAAQKVADGEMTFEEYRDLVQEVLPPERIGQLMEVPTFEQIALGLDKNPQNTAGIIGLNINIPDGTAASSRLDINAYENQGVWANTIHEGGKQSGTVLGYGPTTVLNNVTFSSNPKQALEIAMGKSKTPIGRIDGTWENRDPKLVVEQVRSILDGTAPDAGDWVEVGMNPIRGSGFYNKATFELVGESDQILQVGPVVLAKKPTYIKPNDPRNMVMDKGQPRLDKSGNPVFFSGGGNTGTAIAAGSAVSNAARLRRADEQGFGDVLYHATATREPIDAFAGDRLGITYLTTDRDFANQWMGKGGAITPIEDFPDIEDEFVRGQRELEQKYVRDGTLTDAEGYYREYDNLRKSLQSTDQAIYPVRTRVENTFDPTVNVDVLDDLIRMKGSDPDATSLQTGLTDRQVHQSGNYLLYEKPSVVEFLKERGFDSMRLSEGMDQPITTVAVFDPAKIRSINAEFNPDRMGSANILYSGGGRTGTGIAAGSALRQMNPNLDQSYEARMQRAQEQGYLPETVYHGTAADFDQFNPNQFGGSVTSAGSAKMGTWFSDKPSVSAGYARMAAEDAPVSNLLRQADEAARSGDFDKQERLILQAEELEPQLIDSGGQNIIPARIRGNLMEIDAAGATMSDLDESQLLKWSQEAKEKGFDGLKINNFSDNADYGVYDPANHYLIFDRKNIRSTNAEFDPQNIDSADLLSSRSRPMSALRGMA